MSLNYNAPILGSKSDIDGAGSDQMNSYYYLRKAVIDARKDQYFMPLANVTNIPKHFGKTIKVHQYVPILDDRNLNSQGLDAAGATISATNYIVTIPTRTPAVANASKATAAAALNANIDGVVATAGADGSGGSGLATITLVGGSSGVNTDVGSVTFRVTSITQANAITALEIGAKARQGSGNLYGSSRDVGTVSGRLPVLGENGGRVNRVGSTRLALEGSIHKFGAFTEFTQESLDFDSDDMLREHLSRELINAAAQLTEACLQVDLLTAAGTTLYAGAATTHATVSAEGGAAAAILDYADFVRFDQMLTEARCPKHTTVSTGSLLTDTNTLPACRVLYVGSAMMPHLKAMVDTFGNKAFIAVQHYAAAGHVMAGEEGCIDQFRIIQVPEMLHWEGAGASVGTNPGYRATADKYDVYPLLCVGDDSFSTIGFQSDGKTVKFNVVTKMPGKEMVTKEDPYGETGLSSIKWYYGTLIKRAERIGIMKAVAPM
jgi:N4-gp56 family major capsid protein